MSERSNWHFSGKLFYVYAPPIKGRRNKKGELLSKRVQPNAPFRAAEPWQCSVYYFWWEYLRRNIGYKRCCEQGGKGKYALLYSDFGNVHAER